MSKKQINQQQGDAQEPDLRRSWIPAFLSGAVIMTAPIFFLLAETHTIPTSLGMLGFFAGISFGSLGIMPYIEQKPKPIDRD